MSSAEKITAKTIKQAKKFAEVETLSPETNVQQTATDIATASDNAENTPTSTKNLLDNFAEIRLSDVRGRIKLRWIVAGFLMFVLLFQNIAVFGLVVYTLLNDKLADLQSIFAVLVSATLVESAYMVKKIVEFLFKDIQYPD